MSAGERARQKKRLAFHRRSRYTSVMLASAVDQPFIRARMHPISVATYHRLGEIGHLSERTELIRGVIIDQMSKSSLHSKTLMRLLRWLMRVMPPGYSVRPEQPLTLADSEPEPDLAVIAGDDTALAEGHPTTAALVIEVCVTSEDLDRVKLALYAEAGVSEAWLVLAEERILERHTEPQGSAYRRLERAVFHETLECTVFPGLVLPPPRNVSGLRLCAMPDVGTGTSEGWLVLTEERVPVASVRAAR